MVLTGGLIPLGYIGQCREPDAEIRLALIYFFV